jgi:hypothetical protein
VTAAAANTKKKKKGEKEKKRKERRKWLDGEERAKRPYIRARLSINDPPGNNTYTQPGMDNTLQLWAGITVLGEEGKNATL